MKIDPHNNKPLDLLDECHTKYGLNRLRSTSENTRCYYRVCEYDRDSDEWKADWKLGSIGEGMTDVMTETFADIVKRLGQASKQGETALCPTFDAVLVVVSGMGRYFVRAKDGREWEQLTEEEREEVRNEKESAVLPPEYNPTEAVPTRMSIVLTLEGIAREVSILPPGIDPIVERMEEWVHDGNDTTPDASNELDQSVLSLFTFIQIINETVRQGRSFDLTGLMQTAALIPREHGGKEMSAFLLRLISMGVETGIFDLTDLMGSEDDN
jgi:hypothetical protein